MLPVLSSARLGTGQETVGLLRKLNEQDQLTIVMVTRDAAIARQARRIVRLVEGRLTDEKSAELQAAN